MLLEILQHDVLACIGITVYAEMAASIIHANIFADHTSTHFTLTFILEILPFQGNLWNTTEQIWLREFPDMKIVNQFLVISKELFHQLTINAAVMLDAISVQINTLSTGGQRKVPAFVFPVFPQFGESFDQFGQI